MRSSALQTLEKVAAKDAIPDIAVLLEDLKDVYEVPRLPRHDGTRAPHLWQGAR